MVSIHRNGSRHDVDEEAFLQWAAGGNLLPSDYLLDTEDCWRPADTFTQLQPYILAAESARRSRPSVGDLLLAVAAVTAVGVVTYKIAQMVLDEDFGSRAYPASFRAEKIGAHLDAHGSRCLRCDRGVRVRELTVDHIVPWAKGGLTSRFNAAVICGRCNSSKGAAANVMDYLRGRRA